MAKDSIRGRLRVAALGLLAASCVSSGQGEAMRSETARLKARIDEMDTRYSEATQAMDRLRQVVDEANALLTRNSADLGARVEKNDQDVRTLQGQIEELRHLIEQLGKSVADENVKMTQRLDLLDDNQAKLIEKLAPTMPEDKDELWKQANDKLNQGHRDDARRFFKNFLSRFPTDPRAATAQLAIGKSYALENNHRQAAGTFQKVLDDYPQSNEVAEAMFELGQAFVQLKFCTDARAIFLDLSKRYRKSPFAAKARAQADAVQRIQKDKTRCTS